jgi:hypothetical protein
MFEPTNWSSVNFTFIKDKSKYDTIKGWTESGYANFNTDSDTTPEEHAEPEDVTPYEDEDLSELGLDYGEQGSETSSVKSEKSKKQALKPMAFKKNRPPPQYKNLLQPEEFFS